MSGVARHRLAARALTAWAALQAGGAAPPATASALPFAAHGGLNAPCRATLMP